MTPAKPKQVSCPICGKSSIWGPENPSRPFCSERCKLIDLGQWATESYRIPVADDDPDKPQDEPER